METESKTPNSAQKEPVSQPRPTGATLLLWSVLLLSTYGALRFAAALRWWNVLAEFGSSLGVWYLSADGAVWCVVGIALFWMLTARKRRALSALRISAILWYCQFWVEQIFFETARSNTVFMLVVTTIILAIIIVDANLSSVKKHFTKSEEHGQADKNTKVV